METVFINGRFLTRPITGVERVAIELIRAMGEQADDQGVLFHDGQEFRLEIVVPHGDIHQAYHPLPKNIALKAMGPASGPFARGHLWEQFSLVHCARSGYLLSLANSAPAFASNQSLFVHDAAVYEVPDAYSNNYRRFYKTLYWILSLRETPLLVNSHFSRKRVAKFLDAEQALIDVVSVGADTFKSGLRDYQIMEQLKLVPNAYLLAVSSLQSNKNVAGVTKAISQMGKKAPKVIMVGSTRHPSFKELDLESNPNFIHIGRVSDAQLATLYSNAAGLVYPSLYEGFGLPPLEAIVSGTIPLVSKRASMPEVCGPHALYCDPLDSASIAEGMGRLIAMGIEERAQRIRELQRHAAQYTWQAGARKVIEHVSRQLAMRSFGDELNAEESI
jgi:glycosyltransferase involved in cell wall biosynthesis